jgi:hypothetical protein
MEWTEKATHIDFILRSSYPNAAMPKGYWFITEIYIPTKKWNSYVWRKRSDGAWVRLAPSEIPYEFQSIESGNLTKYRDGTVFAAGSLKKRLDKMLRDYMEEHGFNRPQHIYWKSNPQ